MWYIIFIIVLDGGYIVAFTKVLTIYQIYPTWIHCLHHSPLFPSPSIPVIVSTEIIFSIYIHVYIVFALYLPFHVLSLPPPPTTDNNPPKQYLLCPPVFYVIEHLWLTFIVYLLCSRTYSKCFICILLVIVIKIPKHTDCRCYKCL
jgi:hypothetical protein